MGSHHGVATHRLNVSRLLSLYIFVSTYHRGAAFKDEVSDYDSSDFFEEVLHALRGHQGSLPEFKMPGLNSKIRFDSSTGEFEIEWQQLGSTILKLSLLFEKSEPGVISTRNSFRRRFSTPLTYTAQACFKHFARTLLKQVALPPLPNIELLCNNAHDPTAQYGVGRIQRQEGQDGGTSRSQAAQGRPSLK